MGHYVPNPVDIAHSALKYAAVVHSPRNARDVIMKEIERWEDDRSRHTVLWHVSNSRVAARHANEDLEVIRALRKVLALVEALETLPEVDDVVIG